MQEDNFSLMEESSEQVSEMEESSEQASEMEESSEQASEMEESSEQVSSVSLEVVENHLQEIENHVSFMAVFFFVFFIVWLIFKIKKELEIYFQYDCSDAFHKS